MFFGITLFGILLALYFLVFLNIDHDQLKSVDYKNRKIVWCRVI